MHETFLSLTRVSDNFIPLAVNTIYRKKCEFEPPREPHLFTAFWPQQNVMSCRTIRLRKRKLRDDCTNIKQQEENSPPPTL
jgi:hypothetical protein